MRAVEHSELRSFVRGNILDDLGAVIFPTGTMPREVILDNPLAEWLGENGAFVGKADSIVDLRQIAFRSARHDPVDHRCRDGAFALEPGGELGLPRGDPFTHQAAQDVSVVSEVVAGEKCHASHSAPHPQSQSFGE